MELLQPPRPCIDTSGNDHMPGFMEVYDIHDYDGNPETFKARWDGFFQACKEKNQVIEANDKILHELGHEHLSDFPFFEQPYNGQPVFISEYGGIRMADEKSDSWGYLRIFLVYTILILQK